MPIMRQGISDLPDICLQYGIRFAIIAPGSRNAPLTIAFARNQDIRCISITDERSAGYYALGIALWTQKPVVLICTSGTAAINLFPAVSEAYYSRVALVIFTADRPPEWIDQNDGQTIRQTNLFGTMVKKSFTLPVETTNQDDLWHFRRAVSEAINISTTDLPGPVHLNVPLREPLYSPLPQRDHNLKVNHIFKPEISLSSGQWEQIIHGWEKYQKRIILCGASTKNSCLNSSLEYIAKKNSAVILVENLSNLSSPYFIDIPDQLIGSMNESEQMSFAPDLLVTIGDVIVSKKLKKFFRQNKPIEHWHIDQNNFYIDTYQSLTLNIAIKPDDFISKIKDAGMINQAYCSFYFDRQIQIRENLDTFIKSAEYSDLTVYSIIFRNLPLNYSLHLANSTPVRYAQLFGSRGDIVYHSNRGTSGIDGCVSTAAGYALASGLPTLLLSGDLAFIYDSNALWFSQLPGNLKIIVIDNGGGNIFKLIETSSETKGIEQFFETPHRVNIGLLARAYGLDYIEVTQVNNLEAELKEFFKPKPNPVVLSIKTSGIESAKVFNKYFQTISKRK